MVYGIFNLVSLALMFLYYALAAFFGYLTTTDAMVQSTLIVLTMLGIVVMLELAFRVKGAHFDQYTASLGVVVGSIASFIYFAAMIQVIYAYEVRLPNHYLYEFLNDPNFEFGYWESIKFSFLNALTLPPMHVSFFLVACLVSLIVASSVYKWAVALGRKGLYSLTFVALILFVAFVGTTKVINKNTFYQIHVEMDLPTLVYLKDKCSAAEPASYKIARGTAKLVCSNEIIASVGITQLQSVKLFGIGVNSEQDLRIWILWPEGGAERSYKTYLSVNRKLAPPKPEPKELKLMVTSIIRSVNERIPEVPVVVIQPQKPDEWSKFQVN